MGFEMVSEKLVGLTRSLAPIHPISITTSLVYNYPRRYTSRPSPMHPPMRQPPEDERRPAQSLPSLSTARRAKDTVQKAHHHSRTGVTKLKTSLSKRSFGWYVQPAFTKRLIR